MKNENRLGIQIIYQVGIVLKGKWGVGWDWDGRSGKKNPAIFYDMTSEISQDDFLKHLTDNSLPFYDLRDR